MSTQKFATLSAASITKMKILNIPMPPQKPIFGALLQVYGVGQHTARSLCGDLGINPNTRCGNLHDFEAIKKLVESRFEPRHLALRPLGAKILAKVKLGTYQGIRHTMCLPVRGQKTRSNAKTQRKLGKQRATLYGIPLFNKKRGGSQKPEKIAERMRIEANKAAAAGGRAAPPAAASGGASKKK